MFDKLDGILERYDEIMEQLNDPNVVSDQNNFRKLMKEQSDLAPIVEAYKAYKEAKQTVEDSLMILDEESDEEMRELAKEEMNEAKEQITELEEKLKILLLPKDENDDKNVVGATVVGATVVGATVVVGATIVVGATVVVTSSLKLYVIDVASDSLPFLTDFTDIV